MEGWNHNMAGKDNDTREPMLDMFLFETSQLLEQLEGMLIQIEREQSIPPESINEIFRIMHTIKGSSAMMSFDAISVLAHSLEDLFDTIRSGSGITPDCVQLTDIVLQAADFIRGEIGKAEAGEEMDGDSVQLALTIRTYNKGLKGAADAGSSPHVPTSDTDSRQNGGDLVPHANTLILTEEELADVHRYAIRIFFENGCLMENMRAFTVVHSLQEYVLDMRCEPEDIADNEETSSVIRETGFQMQIRSCVDRDTLASILEKTMFLDRLEIDELEIFPWEKVNETTAANDVPTDRSVVSAPGEEDHDRQHAMVRQQSLISVNTSKLDRLLDLVGEMVIAEAMTVRNPDLEGLQLDGFRKSARQLGKLTSELQDIVMSLRMVPIAATFLRMQRLVRDMTRKLDKEVDLYFSGEDTELDKNIIERISDPLMHLIRNALDHGIESPEERVSSGKSPRGKLQLEARSVGGEILITIRDDGRGLDREKILIKARERGLVTRADDEYSDKEVFAFVMLPGFSTKEQVSEFSGRGVGMDVVRDHISKAGGSVYLDSRKARGTTVSIRIPLTLAIIEGMMVSVGDNRYIIPTNVISESFRANPQQIIEDTEGNEMVMLRGECLNVIRLHRRFHTEPFRKDLERGIMVVVEDDDSTVCLFADELLGEQQAVVKPLPEYVRRAPGIGGCTILGDGGISLILDAGGLMAASAVS